jgi:DNA-binding GntR family transcriptional regulator
LVRQVSVFEKVFSRGHLKPVEGSIFFLNILKLNRFMDRPFRPAVDELEVFSGSRSLPPLEEKSLFREYEGVAQSAKQPELRVVPLEANTSLRTLAYDALKRAITEMDIYGQIDPIRLDERQLSQKLGVSRTPIREALTLLEQEGFVRAVPRRGIYVVRKSKKEICEIIVVWAALEGMAARLAAQRATDEQLKALADLFEKFKDEPLSDQMSEYSEANITFHQMIVKLGGCDVIVAMTQNLFIHVRAIRTVSLRQDDRGDRSITDHMAIIGALQARDADLAEKLVREHTLGLAAHVEKHGVFAE